MATTNRRLKAQRVLQGFTQKQLAERIGRSQAWVCELERGRRQPTDIDVALICRVLKVKPDAVFPEANGEERDGQVQRKDSR